MILVCTRWEQPQTPPPGRAAAFSVIVAVNRAWQHELNIARSPGLAEVGAQLICVQGAASAAAAFADGAARARHAWRVMAHQDVYFPAGSGHALAMQLHTIEAAGRAGGTYRTRSGSLAGWAAWRCRPSAGTPTAAISPSPTTSRPPAGSTWTGP